MRVGDEDREQVVAALRKHFAEGNLSLDEFGERVEAAYAAVTSDDLHQSVQDLDLRPPGVSMESPVAPERVPSEPLVRATASAPASRDRGTVARKSFYAHLGPYVVVNLFLVMIYVMTDFGGYFWPIWPAMGWGVGLGIHAWAAFVLANRD